MSITSTQNEDTVPQRLHCCTIILFFNQSNSGRPAGVIGENYIVMDSELEIVRRCLNSTNVYPASFSSSRGHLVEKPPALLDPVLAFEGEDRYDTAC